MSSQNHIDSMFGSELFQLLMRISFPFLRAKDLHKSLLIMRNRSFLTLVYVGVHTHKYEEETSALHLTY